MRQQTNWQKKKAQNFQHITTGIPDHSEKKKQSSHNKTCKTVTASGRKTETYPEKHLLPTFRFNACT